MIATLKLVSLLLVVATMIPSVAHALELPGKLRLTHEQYLAVQPIYYPGFTIIGAAEPLSVLILAALLALAPGGAALRKAEAQENQNDLTDNPSTEPGQLQLELRPDSGVGACYAVPVTPRRNRLCGRSESATSPLMR
jgi:hypothetical protein